MADFRKVNDKVLVAPQIGTACIDQAAADGVTLIINNRPDFEEANQPTNEELAAYAESKGIKWAFIPVVAGQLTMQGIEMMSYALRDGEKVLAFCRSGTRSCNMWGLAEAFAGSAETPEILECASGAGYDLTGIAPTLEHLRASAN